MNGKVVFTSLFNYMGKFKITMILSIVLAAIAAVLNFSAFVCVYYVAKEIVQSMGDFSALNQAYLVAVFFIPGATTDHFSVVNKNKIITASRYQFQVVGDNKLCFSQAG